MRPIFYKEIFEKKYSTRFALLLICLLSSVFAFAQPINDECDTPIVLTDVTAFCSNNGAFTNVGATPSTYGPATCFTNTENDVWFSFTPTATDINIIVRGATAQAPGGTLQSPQISLYFGTCGGTINQLECQSDNAANGLVEAYQGGLFVGSPYLIRVQGLGGNTGTFQLCLNNYNYPVDPASDCPDAAILCDKSPFVVESVTGAGNNNGELDDATCFSNGVPGVNESNSTWFTWTCQQSGALTFTLTPQNGPDDLDFVLYELPNGLGNCTGKQVLRCMASGDFLFPSPCMGPTGLSLTDTDVSEDAGCQTAGKNNFLAPLNMVAGTSYALCVNNFTSTGNGFGIEFGGSGTFLGPEAKFETNPIEVCLGTPVQVTDQSTFALGAVTGWSWSFGANAGPQTATGPGPHTVTFDQPGVNSVVLAIESNLGCRVTHIQEVIVHPDVELDTLIGVPDCNGGSNGSITVNNITMGSPPFQFSWNNGPFQLDNTLTGLSVGVYDLVIKDANNCETDVTIDVQELTLVVDPIVVPPLCFGDSNGEITLNVINGNAPYVFDWNDGNGFVPEETMNVFSAGTYTFQGEDITKCKGTFEVTVLDNPVLVLSMDTVDISCFGADDGVATANPVGGVGNYTYVWSNGGTTQSIEGLVEGEYTVTVSDGNECVVVGSVFITEPGELSLLLISDEDLICFGDMTGSATVEAVGGTGPFVYSSDGNTFGTSPILEGLTNGNYTLWVEDAEGCRATTTTEITSPPPVIVIAEPDTTLDLGYTVQIRTIVAPGTSNFTYEWTPALGLSCTDCQEPVVTGTVSQTYVIKITDEDNCMATDSVLIMVNQNRPIYAPNVFMPSSNTNGFFTLFGGPAATQIDILRIYDRWGSLVFEGENIAISDESVGWDGMVRGKNAESGVYTYYAYVRFVDDVSLLYEGDVTIIR